MVGGKRKARGWDGDSEENGFGGGQTEGNVNNVTRLAFRV